MAEGSDGVVERVRIYERWPTVELRWHDGGMNMRTVTLACAVIVSLVPVTPAHAAPPDKARALQNLIAAAQREVDAANFERAAQLFLEIWRQDKSLPIVLYNAARAHHLAGKLDKADELYNEYL
jgi:TolA-binding protein